MAMTDPIADLLTRIRNGHRASMRRVDMPFSQVKGRVLDVLKQHGFIEDFETELVEGKATLRVRLKYGPDGERMFSHLQRVSRPGRRVYVGAEKVPAPLDGLGLAILSTSVGVVSHVEAKRRKIGGEILCEVW